MNKGYLFYWSCIIALLALTAYQTKSRLDDKERIALLSYRVSKVRDLRYLVGSHLIDPSARDSLSCARRPKLLVLRFLKTDCNDCTEAVFKNTELIASKIGYDNVAVLLGNCSVNDYYKYVRLYMGKISKCIYYPKMVSKADDSMESYYFVTTEGSPFANSLFISRPSDEPELTSNYLEGVSNAF